MLSLLDVHTTGSSATRSDPVAAGLPAQPVATPGTTGPPFFVVGADRSGTTMLRLILNRHPELAIPPESHFLVPLLAALPLRTKLTADQLKCAADIITRCPSFSTWRTTTQELGETFCRQGEPTLATLVDAAFRLEIAVTGKLQWGDKTPAYAGLIEPLHELFPHARFVHIVRDGRDVSISLRKRQWHGWTEYQRARYWSSVVLAADAAGHRIGSDRYMRVAYEDLVLSCESTVRRLCDFLRIEFHPVMIAFHEDASQHIADFERRSGIHEKLTRPPRPSDVGRWRQESSAVRVWLFEAIAGGALEQVGIARRYRGAARWLGAITGAPYRAVGGSVACVQRLFEHLPKPIRDHLRSNRLFRRLKQATNRC